MNLVNIGLGADPVNTDLDKKIHTLGHMGKNLDRALFPVNKKNKNLRDL